MTGALLEAARTALANGATSVSLSANGCLKYERTVQGKLLVSEKLTDNGVDVLTFTRTPQTATRSGDFDRDGFAEWSRVVTRGANPLADKAVVTISSQTKVPIERKTYTWSDASTIHVVVESDDGKGGLVKVREFDTTRFQADTLTPSSHVTTTNCTAAQAALIDRRLREAMDGDPADKDSGGLACLHRQGARDKEMRLTVAYVRDIEIECVTDASIGAVYDGAGWFDNATSIRVNPVNFEKAQRSCSASPSLSRDASRAGRPRPRDPQVRARRGARPDRGVRQHVLAGSANDEVLVRDLPRNQHLRSRCAKFRPCKLRTYSVTGGSAGLTYSGAICNLEKPFTITGTNAAITYAWQFTPSSATAGAVSHSGVGLATAVGSGSYTIEGAGTDKARIVLHEVTTGTAPVGSRTAAASIYFDIVRLEIPGCR